MFKTTLITININSKITFYLKSQRKDRLVKV